MGTLGTAQFYSNDAAGDHILFTLFFAEGALCSSFAPQGIQGLDGSLSEPDWLSFKNKWGKSFCKK